MRRLTGVDDGRPGALRAGGGSSMVCRGDPGHGVVAACQRARVDLLVLGRRGRHAKGPDTVGSTTRLGVRAAPCPVLVVPDGVRQPLPSATASHAPGVRAAPASHPGS